MKSSIIKLQDVWKIYKVGKVQVEALRGITLEIEKGEFVVITGHSGSGKSTMMNMVGCLDKPTKGDIYLDNKNILSLHESRLAEIRGQKVGFVFQQFNLIPTLTALENVMLPMEFQEVSAEKIKERAKKVLELVGLKDRLNHKPNELSGGEQQRVAIARALANNPEVILADEPTGNLDSKTGHYLMDFLCQLHKKEGKTLIIVTHDVSLIESKSITKIIQLKDGQIEKEIYGHKKSRKEVV